MVPACLKLQPDSLSGGQKALYLRGASDLVKLCLVLSGVIVSCLVFNGRLSSFFFSYVVRPCLVLSCVLLHTNPFHYTFFIMTYPLILLNYTNTKHRTESNKLIE